MRGAWPLPMVGRVAPTVRAPASLVLGRHSYSPMRRTTREEHAMNVNGYVKNESLVSTAWVAEHGNDPAVRLIEVDVDTSAYDTGHIEGAVGWHWQNDLQRH